MKDKIEHNYEDSLVSKFLNKFDRLKHRDIVLYGLGPLTKMILEKTKDFNIMGLLSNEKTDIGKKYYGLNVLSINEIIEHRPIVIIVARTEIEQLILKDLLILKEKYNIEIYFKEGSIAKLDPICKPNISWKIREDDLLKLAKKYDVVSFDVFDTLITRSIDRPSDIFHVVNSICVNKFGSELDYLSLRRQAESHFNNMKCDATIDEIYDYMANENSFLKLHKYEIYNIELKVEANFIIPCKKMIDIYRNILTNEITVLLITDMYLPKDFITGILNAYGIDGYKKLYISSYEGVNKKSTKLFLKVQASINGNILHIGDNLQSDIQAGNKSGFDTFHVLNARDYLLSSSMSGIINVTNSIGDRVMAGILAKRVFGNPFLRLDKTNGVPLINTFQDFGYIILGPVSLGYILWLCDRCKDK